MSSTKSRIALAALVAALSTPALAADAATCSVCDDPTWPDVENPAPAVAAYAQGGEAEALVRADPTWPETKSAAPALALVPHADESPLLDPAPAGEPAPSVHYAVEFVEQTRRVAARP